MFTTTSTPRTKIRFSRLNIEVGRKNIINDKATSTCGKECRKFRQYSYRLLLRFWRHFAFLFVFFSFPILFLIRLSNCFQFEWVMDYIWWLSQFFYFLFRFSRREWYDSQSKIQSNEEIELDWNQNQNLQSEEYLRVANQYFGIYYYPNIFAT